MSMKKKSSREKKVTERQQLKLSDFYQIMNGLTRENGDDENFRLGLRKFRLEIAALIWKIVEVLEEEHGCN